MMDKVQKPSKSEQYVEYLRLQPFTHITWLFRFKIIYAPERGKELQ
jgi:hypothetical protein